MPSVWGQEAPDAGWRFTLTQHRSAPLIEEPPAVVVGDTIYVRGSFTTGCATARISGTVRRREGGADVLVRAQIPEGNLCLMMTEFYSYEFAIDRWLEAEHQIRLTHEGDQGAGLEPTVLLEALVGSRW